MIQIIKNLTDIGFSVFGGVPMTLLNTLKYFLLQNVLIIFIALMKKKIQFQDKKKKNADIVQ